MWLDVRQSLLPRGQRGQHMSVAMQPKRSLCHVGSLGQGQMHEGRFRGHILVMHWNDHLLLHFRC